MKNDNLDRFRKKIASMPDKELARLLAALSKAQPADVKGEKLKLPDSVSRQLDSFRSSMDQGRQLDNEQQLWVRTVEKMKKLQVRMPESYSKMTDEEIYRTVRDTCRRNLLPDNMVSTILPSLMDYIKTGTMERPILFHGSAGCGKTWAAKVLIEEVLQLPAFVCAATDSCGRGLAGRTLSYRGASYGSILQACLEGERLNPGIVIDEIDKCIHSPDEAAVEDLLLSMFDDRRRIEENFIGMSLPTLRIPFFLTANETDRISEPLLDRCLVYEYPDASEEQIFSICQNHRDFLANKGGYANRVELTDEVLRKAIGELYLREHSIRQHKKLVEIVMGQGNCASLEHKCRKISIPIEAFSQEIQKSNRKTAKKTLGFR